MHVFISAFGSGVCVMDLNDYSVLNFFHLSFKFTIYEKALSEKIQIRLQPYLVSFQSLIVKGEPQQRQG